MQSGSFPHSHGGGRESGADRMDCSRVCLPIAGIPDSYTKTAVGRITRLLWGFLPSLHDLPYGSDSAFPVLCMLYLLRPDYGWRPLPPKATYTRARLPRLDCFFFVLPGGRARCGGKVAEFGRMVVSCNELGGRTWFHVISNAPFAVGNARLLGKPTSPVTDKTTQVFVGRCPAHFIAVFA